MQSEGFIPNLFTFDVVLSIYRSAGLPDEALEAYDSMVGKYNLKASKEHYDYMIDILTLAERIEELQRFIKLKSLIFL
jgi:pentatricopeptide repeat protein